jgi:hypothetical protein
MLLGGSLAPGAFQETIRTTEIRRGDTRDGEGEVREDEATR